MRDREVSRNTKKKDKGTDKQVIANAHRREKTKHAKAYFFIVANKMAA